MTSLTSLAVFVAMLALWVGVPSQAYNIRMYHCDQDKMPSVSDVDLDQISGRWYVSHISTPPLVSFSQYSGFAFDISKASPLKVDNRGNANQDFLVLRPVWIKGSDCSRATWLCEMIGDACASSYATMYYNAFVTLNPGYYVNWSEYYVLATDYTSTAVLMIYPVLDGTKDKFFSEIQVLVRDASVAPDASVVSNALDGFCSGDFLDLDSNYYVTFPNNSTETCFQPPMI